MSTIDKKTDKLFMAATLSEESLGYDTDGDVLYLTRGESNMAAEAVLTPEGHGVRY